MSFAFCCGTCDDPDPRWRIQRTGDVVTTWACDEHLSAECHVLQRDGEVTELTVWDARKLRERAGREVAGVPA